MKHFCAYQERCQQEVYQKMRAASLTAEEADTIISRLIEENYLNEERFARQFAGGHFRLKKWGKQKNSVCAEAKANQRLLHTQSHGRDRRG
jgi:hypothetical protein